MIRSFDLPGEVDALLGALEAAGFQAYVVGGSVRDMFLNRAANDYDVATDARPHEVMSLFPRTIETGVAYGTVTVIEKSGRPVEVTTFRSETSYADSRHPDAVTFSKSILDDLKRRDFTINAMAMDRHGYVIDLFDGLTDLTNRRVRAVGDAHVRFAEDSLRILRAFRLAAQLEFDIDEVTYRGMERCAARLQSISCERIGRELWKIMYTNWFTVIGKLAEGPWLTYFPSPWPHMQAVFQSLYTRSKQADEKWRSLCKETFAQADSCAIIDAFDTTLALWSSVAAVHNLPLDAFELCKALTWPAQRGRLARDAARLSRSDVPTWTDDTWRQNLYTYGRSAVKMACVVTDWESREVRSYRRVADAYIADMPVWSVADLVIDGHDLLQLGAQGPTIGKILKRIACDVVRKRLRNEREELLVYAADLLQRGCDDK